MYGGGPLDQHFTVKIVVVDPTGTAVGSVSQFVAPTTIVWQCVSTSIHLVSKP